MSAVVTLFTKQNCPYCTYVKDMLDAHISRLNQANTTTTPPLLLKTYDCIDGARAAQCIKFTNGTTTVPHVFFNEKYIGDADTLIKMDQDNQTLLLQQLRDISDTPCIDFPPTPEASIIKVTEKIAFSSQPTDEQLQKLHSFGFRSVINLLCSVSEHAYVPHEGDLLEATDVVYKCVGISKVLNKEQRLSQTDEILSLIQSCPEPILIHCDTGRRACAFVLLHAARLMKTNISQIYKWSQDLGHDLQITKGIPHAFVTEALLAYFERKVEQEMEEKEKGTDKDTTKKSTKSIPPLPCHKKAPPLPPNGTLKKSKPETTTKYSTSKTTEDVVDPQQIWRRTYPIHAAACGVGDKSLESLLLDNVLDIDGVDNEGWTALHRAAWNGQTNAIALLLSHQANPNSRTNESISGIHSSRTVERKTTPLHYAAGMGHMDCVKLLLEGGADRCAVDCEGWTALIVAKKTAEDVQFKNQNGKVEESTWSKIYDLLEVEGS